MEPSVTMESLNSHSTTPLSSLSSLDRGFATRTNKEGVEVEVKVDDCAVAAYAVKAVKAMNAAKALKAAGAEKDAEDTEEDEVVNAVKAAGVVGAEKDQESKEDTDAAVLGLPRFCGSCGIGNVRRSPTFCTDCGARFDQRLRQ
jgi:hypothetical protein